MTKFYTFIFLLLTTANYSQIKGVVTDQNGTPLPFVTITEENTYNGTTSNELGVFELVLKNNTQTKVSFQYLGFKTQKLSFDSNSEKQELKIQLEEEGYNLNEVVIDANVNPAIAIIKKAIANRKLNSDKTARFSADFYSRGIFKLKNAPKKFLGQEIGDMNGSLDSTGTGIISLSETFSKIVYEKPNKLKEIVTASKISGDNKGYSYNTARSSFYDFYDNTVKFGINLISPIADNAFNYYHYKLENSFVDDNKLIHKIKVIAKRDSEPVFEGFIYIVEDSWAIYAIDLNIKGYRMKEEFIENMNLKQNFSFNNTTRIWAKNTQSLEFTAGAFGILFTGKFNYVYTNYIFQNSFEPKTFSNEITKVEINANKKDSVFWNSNRPIPLTLEENTDYIKKDSIHNYRNSKKYLDSIDTKNNKFKILSPITGYTYKNSTKKHSFSYDGILNLESFSFNTVQGFNLDSGFGYRNWNGEDEGKNTAVKAVFNYGFSDDRLRFTANYHHQFNNQNYATLVISGGSTVKQFNKDEPITPFINAISSLFFKDNYMKIYNLEFAKINYRQDIANGVNLNMKIGYEKRKPLFNTTDYSFFNKDDFYSSNNPLLPFDTTTPGFKEHQIIKTNLTAKINFGNKYASRPDGKYNIRNSKYPTLQLDLENGAASSIKQYNFTHFSANVFYNLSLSNKGILGINTKAGTFINANNIAFVDYKHFNGNQTHVGTDARYLNNFNRMPYYSNSTNKSYFEWHSEYNDKGFFMNKIPLLNQLKSTLNVGFHNVSTADHKPYSEFSIGLDNLGFGKFKLFRIDYVRSYQNGYQGEGVVFGLKILNLL